MKAHIHNRSVLKNIEQFSALVHGQNLKKNRDRKRTYEGFINRSTGDIVFPENLESTEELTAKEWKKVYLRLQSGQEQCFDVVEDKEEHVYHYTDATPVANHVMEQTIKVLNFIYQTIENHKELSPLLREIAALELDYMESEAKGDELVKQAWYEVDRLGAEKLLFNNVAGTYLFRKDLYASILEQAFPIECLTLTYLGPRGKVVDLTIVHKDDRWLIFNDDLTFSGPTYPDVASLVESLGSKLCLPLLHP